MCLVTQSGFPAVGVVSQIGMMSDDKRELGLDVLDENSPDISSDMIDRNDGFECDEIETARDAADQTSKDMDEFEQSSLVLSDDRKDDEYLGTVISVDEKIVDAPESDICRDESDTNETSELPTPKNWSTFTSENQYSSEKVGPGLAPNQKLEYTAAELKDGKTVEVNYIEEVVEDAREELKTEIISREYRFENSGLRGYAFKELLGEGGYGVVFQARRLIDSLDVFILQHISHHLFFRLRSSLCTKRVYRKMKFTTTPNTVRSPKRRYPCSLSKMKALVNSLTHS